MEALVRSSSTLFAKASFNKPTSPVKGLLGQSSIFFVRFGNSNANVHCQTLSLRHKAIRSNHSSDTTVLRNSPSEGFGIKPAAGKLSFDLVQLLNSNNQMKCNYGDNFLLVGNEPMIGEWNPSSAVPLNWSDGNIWTVDLNIPIDRAIQFKFILKKSTGDLLWQPGPDRILHTWDTTSIITIAEDWKNAKLQKLTENKKVNGAAINGIPTTYSNMNEQESQEVCMANDGLRTMSKTSSVGSMEDEDERCETEYYDDEYCNYDCEYEARFEDEELMFPFEQGRVLVPGLVQGVAGKTIDINTGSSLVVAA